jgi:RimJ/RimL family protein N-acetyltransferase
VEARLAKLIAINPQEHLDLFKALYAESLEWTSSSTIYSVVDYEAALLNTSSVWRAYVENGTALGIAGFQNINLIDGSADPLVGIVHSARRNGHGLAMGLAMCDFGFNELNLRVGRTAVLKDAPSRQLLVKLGFKHEATMEKARFRNGKYEDVMAYRLFREEYEQCHPQ